MWPFKSGVPHRLNAICVFVSSLALSGCIQPLYGPTISGAPLAAELQAIAIDPIPDRLGHYLGNELIFSLNGTGTNVTPHYRLSVKLRERVLTTIQDTVTGRNATSATVVVEADYRLTTVPDNKEITSGIASSIASYDRFSNRLSDVRAAYDAEIRDAKVLADNIRTRILAALSVR
jgi:LPS-assembly lipoprotein